MSMRAMVREYGEIDLGMGCGRRRPAFCRVKAEPLSLREASAADSETWRCGTKQGKSTGKRRLRTAKRPIGLRPTGLLGLERKNAYLPMPMGEKTRYITTTTAEPTAAHSLPVFQGVMSMIFASGISHASFRGQTLMQTA